MDDTDRAFFSPSYKIARERFLKAAEQASARVISFPLDLQGREDEELFIDVAWLGSKAPERVVFHSSGVHGVEGFAGSAIQLQFLSVATKLPDDTAVVIIHIVNPYGMSWLRRWNENNVDLNRNCLTDALWETYAKNVNSVYGAFEHFLLPTSEPLVWSVDFWTSAIYYVGYYGFNTIKQGVAGGQYHLPKGLFYGGNEIEKGIKLLFSFLVEHFSNAAHYCHVDVHTGLGAKGHDTLLLSVQQDSEWVEILGDTELMLDASGISYKVHGDIIFGMRSLFAPFEAEGDVGEFSFLNESGATREQRKSTSRSFHEVTQEFGTVDPMSVAKALREENFYYQQNHQLKNHWSKDQLVDTFRINEPEWETSVVQRGKWLLQRVIGHVIKLK